MIYSVGFLDVASHLFSPEDTLVVRIGITH